MKVKKWLVFTYIKPNLQTKYKLINPKLGQLTLSSLVSI